MSGLGLGLGLGLGIEAALARAQPLRPRRAAAVTPGAGAHTSPISPPYLAYISQVHALLRERRKEVEAALAALPPPP